jgi:hypothetical protein
VIVGYIGTSWRRLQNRNINNTPFRSVVSGNHRDFIVFLDTHSQECPGNSIGFNKFFRWFFSQTPFFFVTKASGMEEYFLIDNTENQKLFTDVIIEY